MTISCFAATAHAQSAYVAPPASPPPSARQLELSNQLVDAMGLRSNYATLLHGAMGQISNAALAGAAAQNPHTADAMRGAIDDAFDKMMVKIVDVMVDVNARTFSEEELTQLLAFYQSPTGKALVAKTPELARQTMAEVLPLMPQFQRDMLDDFCGRLPCTPEMRKAIFDRLTAAQPKG
jgi:hypothetical protein